MFRLCPGSNRYRIVDIGFDVNRTVGSLPEDAIRSLHKRQDRLLPLGTANQEYGSSGNESFRRRAETFSQGIAPFQKQKCTIILMYIKSLSACRSRRSRLDCLSQMAGHEAPKICGAVPRARDQASLP